jgi:hypothetical protein
MVPERLATQRRWLVVGRFGNRFHPLLKIRHPEVRERASVFFSLRVGPKDLVFKYPIKLRYQIQTDVLPDDLSS